MAAVRLIDDLDLRGPEPQRDPGLTEVEPPPLESPEDGAIPEDEDSATEDEILLDAVEAGAQDASAAKSGNLPEPNLARAPALTGRWSSLSRGSLAVSLIGSTSLSGAPVELPFQPARASPNTNIAAIEQRAPVTSAGAQVAKQKETDMSGNGPGPCWLSANRDKTLPLPPFVSRAWLLPKISLQNNPRLMREIHEWRQEIRDDTGFYWSDERPVTPEQIADVVIGGLRHANFVRVLTRIVIRIRNDKDFNLFESFRKKVAPAIYRGHPLASPLPGSTHRRHPIGCRGHPHNSGDVVSGGRGVDDVLLLYNAWQGVRGVSPGIHITSRAQRTLELSDVDEFLSAADDLEKDIDWDRDIVDQHGARRSPPAPRDGGGAVACGPEDGAEPQTACEAIAGAHDEHDDTDRLDAYETARESEHAAASCLPRRGSEELTGAPDEIAVSPPSVEASLADTCGRAADDPAAVALDLWRQAMTEIKAATGCADCLDPNPDILREVVGLARRARAALRGWQAAQPRLVDAAPLVARARDILDRLCAFQKRNASAEGSWLPSPQRCCRSNPVPSRKPGHSWTDPRRHWPVRRFSNRRAKPLRSKASISVSTA